VKGAAVAEAIPETDAAPLLGSLATMAGARGAHGIEARIAELRAFLEDDLAGIEAGLGELDPKDTPLHASARHLVSSGGKRLRPLCVALASRMGSGFSDAAKDLAIAAELVHSATLLHDDVVDLGDKRRGAASARVIYGNAASIFAGDWLLVEALVRVQRAGMTDVLDRALAVLGEMLEAEALQLARRGRVDGTRGDYLRVVTGKTASLFRWAMFAGARAGGVSREGILALERYGDRLGIAFQIVDDTLDVEGDEVALGKGLFADLREGKLTYPLMVALERDPELRGVLERGLGDGVELTDADAMGYAVRAMRATGAVDSARRWAEELVAEAREALSVLPAGPARRALEGVASGVVSRKR
jgi:octaprenyl-diphosphate synthase